MKRTTKLVSVLLAVLIALSSFAILPISAFDHSSKAPGSSYEFGDVNRDGVIDIIDATIVQKYSVDKATLDNEQKILGDVNGDGEVDILDATLVQKFVVDRISKFPVEDKLPTEPTTIEEPTEAPEGDYYILGTMNGWSVSDDYKLTANEAADGEFVFTGLKLKTTDQFKVAYSVAGAEPKMWFPNGYNDNYGQNGEITADGTYDLYFRPDGQGGEDWFKGVIYLEAKEAPTAEPDTTVKPEPDTTAKPEPDTTVKPEPDTTVKPEPDTTAKPEPDTTVKPEPQTTVMPEPDTTAAPEPGSEGYYIVGTMTDWGINPDYKLTANEAAEGEYMFTGLNLTPTDQFKVVYSEDGLVAKTWYPEGMDNNFGQNGEIKAVGVYDIYFRPDGQGGEDWFNGVIYAANQEEPQPTEEVTTAAPEPDTTAEPGKTITVKFTDALGWGAANVYYWPNGAEWPGTAMEKAEVNDYGQQVYTAEIPADVTGIIFNGNGKQTVDIKDGIADGAQWYTTDEKDGDNYKVVLVGETPTEEVTTAADEPDTTAAPEPGSEGYYIVGTMTDWGINPDYKLTANEAAEGEYMFTGLNLTPTDQFKVVYSEDGSVAKTWYPEGMDNNFGQNGEIKAVGVYDIYFRPDGQGGEDWFNGVIYAANQDEPQPTDAPETTATPEPTEEGTTAEPGETITVKFTDALGWGDVHVYYWPNGAEWPGTAMEKAEVNDYGQQVYTAEIPADVTGIIFNGNGNQTVDIKTDIADGAQWYTIDEKEGDNYKVVLVGEVPTEEPKPTDEPDTTAAPEPGEEGYYIVGTMTDWGINPDYKLTANEAAEGEYMFTGLNLTPTDQFKVVYSEDGLVAKTWYPEGMDNNFGQNGEIKAVGVYDIYFRPDGQGGEDWFYGVIYAANQEEPQPTEEVTTAAPEPDTTAEPGETITVKFTDALGWGAANVYYWPNGAEWPGTAMTKAEVNDFGQQVYTAEIPANVDGIVFNGNGKQTVDIKTDIADGAQWYTIDEKEGDNYKVVLVGEVPTEEPKPTDEPDTTAAPEPGSEGYYIVGTMTDWGINPDYKLTANEAAEGEYMFTGLNLTPTDQFKVVYSEDGLVAKTWYPEGMDNNFGQNGEIKAVGVYDIYFRPDGQGGEDWFNGVIYAANQEEPQPTEEVTTAAPEPDTTAEPGETITVKFTDALGWGAANVYYWPNGAEWPGTAMEKAEVNDYGQQVYTAEIPANVDGIIFNGNGNQTVDIKTDIADGAQWYTIDEKEGTAYKVVLVGEVPTEEPKPTDEPDTTVAPEPGSEGFYIVGTMTDWGINPDYKLTANEAAESEYMFTGLNLTPTDQFKVVYSEDGSVAKTWYPEGMDNNFGQNGEIKAVGVYDIYFRPDGQGGEDWFNGVIYAANQDEPQPTEEVTTAAPEPDTTAEPGETITVKFTDALGWGAANVYYWPNGAEWPGTAMTKAEVNDYGQQVYTAEIPANVDGIIFNGNGNQTVDIKTDIADGAQWYTIDEKEGDNYKVVLVGETPTEEVTTAADEPDTTAAPEPGSEGYYIVGTMTDWGINPDYKLTANEAAEGEYMFTGLNLTTTDEFKVVYSEDGLAAKYWYPDGTDNNYGQNGEIKAVGVYDIYFRPDGQGGEDWFNGVIYAANQDEPQPTEEVTTAAPEPDTSAEPGETITVKFTDALRWGDVHVYYWDNGAEWPGTAMTKAEVNDYGQQVYTAEIPANVDGIIFNGNGNQTVDIKDGIADGAQWYTIDEKEGTAYKVVLVGETPTEEVTTAAPEPDTTAEPSTPECIGAILLTDNFNWGTAYVYAWDADGNSLYGDWPGTEVKETRTNDMGETQFVINIPDGAAGIVVNNNKGAQTEDITDFVSYDGYWMDGTTDNLGRYLVTGYKDGEEPTAKPSEEATTAAPEPTQPQTTGTFLLTDNFGWGKAYVYAWDGDGNELYGAWPGIEIKETTTNDMDQTQFVVEVPKGAAGVIVNNGTGAQTEDITDFSFDGYWMDGTTNELGHYVVTGFKTGENPTEEATTAAPEPDTTAEPTEAGETITVKFTDALGWGAANVYYWPNGAEWPGTAMTKAEVNDYGQQVYTAEIPADVTGIIFNGNGNQTVDIKTDIADGAQWYTIDEKEGTAYKVNLVGAEPATEATTEAVEPTTAEPTVVTEPTEEPTETTPVNTITVKFTDALSWGDVHVYYWDNGAEWPGTAMAKAEVNDFGQQVYTAEIPANVKGIIFNGNGNQTVDIKTDIADGAQWYTIDEKEGNNYKVTLVGAEPATEATTEVVEPTTVETEPTEATEPTEEPAETITIKFTDALKWGAANVYYWPNGAEWPGTAMTKAEVNDYGQQVYTAEIPADVTGIIFNGNGNQTVDIKTDIADGAQWYTVNEKDGNNYKVVLVTDEEPTEDPTPDPEPTGTTVKLQPNSNWTQANARFAIYVFNDSTGANAWADMTAVGDGTYTVTIPEGTWDKVIFVRMNPSATENNWNNKWNQSANLDITNEKLYTVPSNSWDNWTA